MAFCAWCGSQVLQVSYAACPRCGSPSNGAQRAPGAGRSSANPALIVLAVVVGGLIVVAILGILAAIAIPNFLTAKQRAMQKRTMTDMRSIGAAVDAYAVDKNRFPSGSEDVQSLSGELSPTYIKAVPGTDAWGTPMRYRNLDSGGYVISSAGADKQFEDEPVGGKTGHFDCDIMFANGSFVQYPEGVQTGGQ